MNYKYFILAVYLGFVALVMTMVFKSCGQTIELESADYYNEELKYQSTIDAKNLGNPFRDSFRIELAGEKVRLKTPSIPETDSVRLEFRKPDNSAADRTYSFAGAHVSELPVSDFREGVYRLNIRVYTAKGEHLVEKNVKF